MNNYNFSLFDDKDYFNENSIYHYFIRRNLRAGLKLRCLHHFFKSLRMLRFYNYYFFNKVKHNYKFSLGFDFENSFLAQYEKDFPMFSIKLDNEYKGRHKTKRKYMYSVFLERLRSRCFELVL